ncbi:hypothetical protein D6851_02445 [Altericroceibacterium spongiae]|uniref:Uncharacterized protein n=1 Tax=Altericroceibacterium spongiae TaxID=2320269 RepID=A0A420ERR0_9SPHN|nr:hypothetical protein [Altericroceibacterium spongiae]RKF23351.1 hypothetical protein D6851_02445 [Altericroceibacterium spongiae]
MSLNSGRPPRAPCFGVSEEEIAAELQRHPSLSLHAAVSRIETRKAYARRGQPCPPSLIDIVANKDAAALARALADIRAFGKAHARPKGRAA